MVNIEKKLTAESLLDLCDAEHRRFISTYRFLVEIKETIGELIEAAEELRERYPKFVKAIDRFYLHTSNQIRGINTDPIRPWAVVECDPKARYEPIKNPTETQGVAEELSRKFEVAYKRGFSLQTPITSVLHKYKPREASAIALQAYVLIKIRGIVPADVFLDSVTNYHYKPSKPKNGSAITLPAAKNEHQLLISRG